jgi:hypothetical protein
MMKFNVEPKDVDVVTCLLRIGCNNNIILSLYNKAEDIDYDVLCINREGKLELYDGICDPELLGLQVDGKGQILLNDPAAIMNQMPKPKATKPKTKPRTRK